MIMNKGADKMKETTGKRADRDALEKAMEESFTKWHKAYEMLAAGQEPDKEEVDEIDKD